MQDYRLRRLQHHIRATEVARLLNITRQAVEQFEACERHHRKTQKKYEGALATLIAQRQEAR